MTKDQIVAELIRALDQGIPEKRLLDLLREYRYGADFLGLARTATNRSPDVPPLSDEDRAKVESILRPAYRLVSVAEYVGRPAPPDFWEGVIPQGGLVEFHGQPAAGKSVVALALGIATANGSDQFHSRALNVSGPVAIFQAEGLTRFAGRVLAAVRAIGGDDQIARLPLYIYPGAIDLMDDASVQKVIQALRNIQPTPVLAIFDTLSAHAARSDENLQKDMAQVIDACNTIRREIENLTIILIHHVSKGSTKTPRGSTVLLGAVDAALLVEKQNGISSVKLTKGRDVGELPEMQFELRSMPQSSKDSRGRPRDAVYVVPIGRAAANDVQRRFELLKQQILERLTDTPQSEAALRRALRQSRIRFPNEKFNPALKRLVEEERAARAGRRYVRVRQLPAAESPAA